MRSHLVRKSGVRTPSTWSWSSLGGIALFGALLLALVSCATQDIGSQPALEGKVWDVQSQEFVSLDALVERALSSDIILLGEIHDNPEHHRLQAQLQAAIGHRRRVSALAMEQYDIEQQRDIDAIVQSPLAQGEKLERLRTIMRPGWEWSGYQTLIDMALQHHTPLLAINMSRDSLRQVSKAGFAALGFGEVERLGLHTGWSETQQKQLQKEISDGHCGMLPAAAVAGMSSAQRVRDAIMADKLLAVGSAPVIAITGRGHARRDLAVPLYLKMRAPDRKVLSVGMVEAGTSADPAAYAFGALGRLYDYVAFTKATSRESDPCEGARVPVERGQRQPR